MKPKTKLEKRCVALKERLQDLTIREFEWARHAFGQTAYYHARKGAIKGTFRCTECGHEWIANGAEEVVCPNCGCTLKVEACKKRKFHKDGYFLIIDEIEEFMVSRFFWFCHYCNVEGKVFAQVFEVSQIWTDNKGGEVVIAKNKHSFCYYSKQIFALETPMSVKRFGGHGYYYTFDIRDLAYSHHLVRKMPKHLSYIDWNDSKFDKYDVLYIMQNVSLHPMVETLLKTTNVELAYQMIRRGCFKPNSKDVYANAARLALKVKYDMKGKETDWIDYIAQLVKLGMDWHNPAIVCPSDLNKAHAECSRKIAKIEYEKKRKEALERNKKMNVLYEKERSPFFCFMIQNEDIIIKVLRNVEDFFVEGSEMKHCVYSNSYYDVKSNPYTLILSARQGESWENPKQYLETIEINLKNFQIIQSRGHCNRPSPKHEQIVGLLEKNMPRLKTIAKKMKATA